MEDYKSNSDKSRELKAEKKVESVVSGQAKIRKKGELRKLTGAIISEDANNVKSYILLDVLVPAIKKAISDIVTNGIDMLLYGEAGKTKRNGAASKVSYRSYYKAEQDAPYRSRRNGFDYDEIIFESRGAAERVLDAMNDVISQYGVVSILDLYDLAELQITNNYMLDRYGWTNIAGATAVRVRDGYILKLPKALPLN